MSLTMSTYNMDGVDNTNTDRSIVYQNRYQEGWFFLCDRG